MFDFNTTGLKAGSKIFNGDVEIFHVTNTFISEASVKVPDCENSNMWVTATESAKNGEEITQPIQWFNAVISANKCTVVHEEKANG